MGNGRKKFKSRCRDTSRNLRLSSDPAPCSHPAGLPPNDFLCRDPVFTVPIASRACGHPPCPPWTPAVGERSPS